MTDPTPTRDEAVPVSSTEVLIALREWFGGERYARDYEYLDMQMGPQMKAMLEAVFEERRKRLGSAPAPASGGVDAVALREICEDMLDMHHGRQASMDVDAPSFGRGAAAGWDAAVSAFYKRERASLSPAATPVSEGDMRAFGASDMAAYKWPDDTPEHRAARAAFCEGAALAKPVSEAGGDWRSVLAGMVEAMNRYGHEVGDGDIPSAHRNLISQAEQLLAETTSSVAEDVRALAIVRMFKERIERHGNWDEGCFYYGNTSASELQEPLRLATAALAKPASSIALPPTAEDMAWAMKQMESLP